MEVFIKQFEPYFLNENNIQNFIKYKKELNEDKVIDKKYFKKEINNIIKPMIFIPNEDDSLFWCYYIIKNSETNYELLNNRNILTTKQIKINYIDLIRNNKPILKMHKFDTITNIENNLANDNIINIKTIFSLCAINNINLIFVSNKTFCELILNVGEPVYIIYEFLNGSKYSKKYGYEIGNDEKINYIRATLYKVDNISKPVKSFSAYKTNELLDIAIKLGLETQNNETCKNKPKKELYELIIQYF